MGYKIAETKPTTTRGGTIGMAKICKVSDDMFEIVILVDGKIKSRIVFRTFEETTDCWRTLGNAWFVGR